MTEDTQNLTKKERKQKKKQDKLARQKKEEQAEKYKKLGAYLAILVGIFLIGWYLYSRFTPVEESEKNKAVDQIEEGDWTKGNPEAEMVMIEYSDFQCPACQAYAELIKEVENEYGDSVVIAYRHYPLKQIHFQAELAAQATEAAGKQGQFWEMHDKLFEAQEEWSENRSANKLFEGYAEELGLDVNQFKKDLNSKEVKGLVKADYLSGLEQRINATPTFFVNGEQIVNPTSLEEFEVLINSLSPATASSELVEE